MRDSVFLTYSFSDIRRVRRLREALWMHGLDVWPAKSLTPGTPSWHAEVNLQLARAMCMVAVLSKNSLLSGWVWNALDYAHQHQLPVLPALVDGDPGHILLVTLEGRDWFDLRWSKNYLREVREMEAVIRRLAQSRVIELEA
ncbi:MAG: toll/interleukin-1 receptor domain-containing protein [Anaerolineae bacterium]|nr:toll/interleukin-1 receptor domain-containing protein [Anaerolineae bacterium]